MWRNKKYKYVNTQEVKELTKWCADILRIVQQEVREFFTFRLHLIGSGDNKLAKGCL